MAKAKEQQALDVTAVQAGEKLDISFVAKDPYVTAHSIIEVLENSIEVLRAIDEAKASIQTLQWRVFELNAITVETAPQRVHMVLAAEPLRSVFSPGVVGTFVDGMKAVRQRTKLPQDFPEDSLDSALRVGSVINNGVRDLNLSVLGGPKVEIDKETVEQLVVLNKARFVYSMGTIEGTIVKLESVSRPSFSVRDAASGHVIKCRFSSADVEEEAIDCYKRRVAVKGRIQYNKQGKPLAIEISGPIRRFKQDDELPQMRDILGMDITGGLDAVEFVRGLRDNGD